MLLSHDSYLASIDASLDRLSPEAKRVWIDGDGALWVSQSKLDSRHAKRGGGYDHCPGEPTLWLDVPVERGPERVDFHVVEAPEVSLSGECMSSCVPAALVG